MDFSSLPQQPRSTSRLPMIRSQMNRPHTPESHGQRSRRMRTMGIIHDITGPQPLYSNHLQSTSPSNALPYINSLSSSRRKLSVWEGTSPPSSSHRTSSEAASKLPDTPKQKSKSVVLKLPPARTLRHSSTSTAKRISPTSSGGIVATKEGPPSPTKDLSPRRNLRNRTRPHVSRSPRMSTKQGENTRTTRSRTRAKAEDENNSDMDAEVVASMLVDSAADVPD